MAQHNLNRKKKFIYSHNYQRENLNEILVASQLVSSYKGKERVVFTSLVRKKKIKYFKYELFRKKQNKTPKTNSVRIL